MSRINHKPFKKLSDIQWMEIALEIKHLLHASRDCLRNQGNDTTNVTFFCTDSYYAEAFGMLRALAVLGYGTIYGANNTPATKTNFKWWFDQLQQDVLNEENYGGSNECNFCYERWSKDSVRNKYK